MNAFLDTGTDILIHTVHFKLVPNLWRKFSLDISDLNWTEMKYLKNDTEIHDDIKKVSNKAGGIYLFYIRCPILANNSEYLVYVGRCKSTQHQNLRKRLREYNIEKILLNRPKIKRMRTYWAEYLTVKYVELTDNQKIEEIEDKLIDSLLPPFNSKITNVDTSKAVKAF
jgi:hypothetical protein